MYEDFFSDKVNALKESGQYRDFVTLNRICGSYPLADIKEYNSPAVVWCSNDYLGMSQNPLVRQAMHNAIDRFGAGAGGSRKMGKAIGLIGGYVTGSAEIIDAIRLFSAGFIFTTSLPPAVVAGCIAT